MKELHLICNAHLDPVWQWDWNEGASAALATFYAATNLADEYDYIFCHNEALLYEYVEQYDPALFERIRQLVKAGKWHIMGGWYVQPDCNIPSGEGFVRQIESGLSYFKEKFGIRPSVAVNFDSFGHTQGLVQILAKCGYKGYIFCRPMPDFQTLPAIHFDWQGFDGSHVHAARFEDMTIYCSELGNAVGAITRKMQPWQDEDVAFALWGVGNHGGGASRRDLDALKGFMAEQAANDVRVIHSTPEAFFDAATPKASWTAALQPCFVKCYTSIARLKARYAELENKLLITEKICAYAASEGIYDYNFAAFEEAQKHMAMVQFHDVLSGTCIFEGETSSMRKMDYAIELLDKEFTKAFMALAYDYDKAVPLEFPIFVYNPTLSTEETIFNGEFFMLDAICSDTTGYHFVVRDEEGREVPFQKIKESSCINLERSMRLAIKAPLHPMSMTRFNVSFSVGDRLTADKTPVSEFVNQNGVKAVFDTQDGTLSAYEVEGKSYLTGGALRPVMYSDNEDPWGWHMQTVGYDLTPAACTIPLRVIEKGDLLTTLESFYTTGKSDVRVAYTLYRDFDYIDITVNAYWNDPGKGLKLEIPLSDVEKFIGQTAFGTQIYTQDLEQCAHKFMGVKLSGKDDILTIFKNGTYGCSIEGGKLYIDLLNASVYCAHPVGGRPIIGEERFQKYIDLGRHEFTFRLALCREAELECRATEFAQKPYTLNFYPHGEGHHKDKSPVSLSNSEISLSCFRMIDENTYMIRLFNNDATIKTCTCCVFGTSLTLDFGQYEVKTLLYRDGKLWAHDEMIVL